jgi:hypothetical protein
MTRINRVYNVMRAQVRPGDMPESFMKLFCAVVIGG